jgi:predicted amidohydrolase YtcJ
MERSTADTVIAARAMLAEHGTARLEALPLGPPARRAVAAGLPRFQPGDVPDTVLLNARVHTLSTGAPTAEAIAIKHGRILAVGDTASVRALAGPATEQLDLAGLTVLPGFYDSHNHMRGTGLNFLAVDLAGTRSIADLLAALAARAAITPAGEWVVASSRWHESQLAEQRFPTRAELDAAVPNHPVFIPRGGHNRVANSLAFARAGIADDTPNPPGGTYVRDARTGALTGHVIGRPAFARIDRAMPRPTPEQEDAALRAVVRAYHAAGITSVLEPGLEPPDFAGYQRLWAADALTVRLGIMLRVAPGTTEADLERALAGMRGFGFATGFGDEWLRLSGIKVLADGGVEASYLRQPFAHTDDPSQPCGKPQVTRENLTAVCLLASQLGWQVQVHCVGDACIDLVLDAFRAVHAERPLPGRRWALMHMMRALPEHFARAREMGLVITSQQALMYALGAGFVQYWGAERAAACEPLRMYLESGLPVGNGTDSPVAPYQPLLNLYSATTRETEQAGALGPEWAIPIPDAVRWYTRGSAYVGFEEDLKGTLAVGKLADLVALSADPLVATPTEVRDADVLLTMVGGRIVHDGRGTSDAPPREARGFAPAPSCHCVEPPG